MHNYDKLIGKLHTELKQHLRTMKELQITLDEDNEDGTAYLSVSYPLSEYMKQGFDFGSKHPDTIITEAVKRIMGKFFLKSGSGGGCGWRDIGFVEKEGVTLKRLIEKGVRTNA